MTKSIKAKLFKIIKIYMVNITESQMKEAKKIRQIASPILKFVIGAIL